MKAEEKLTIEVAYARPEKQVIRKLQMPIGTILEEAIKKSGIPIDFPEIDLTVNKVGIFSKVSPLTKVLQDKDRIEIYRELIADPKAVRKQRAESGKVMKKGR